jgi:glc operon protein GlcG
MLRSNPPPCSDPMANLTERRSLTLAGARLIADATVAEAVKHGWQVAVAIVDHAGCPLFALRMEDSLIASWTGALNKATTAIQFGRPTSALEEAVQRGKLHYFAFDNVLPVAGGLPIMIEGAMVGAIGVGGTPTGAEGARCAEIGIAALAKS